MLYLGELVQTYLRIPSPAGADAAGGVSACVSSPPHRVRSLPPQNNKAEYQVQACNQDEVDACFKAAKEAGPAWAKTPLWKRAEYLHKVAASLKENWEVRPQMGLFRSP